MNVSDATLGLFGRIWNLFRKKVPIPPGPPPKPSGTETDNLFQAMNAERSKHGLAMFVRHPSLDASAQGHCARMVSQNVFSHQCSGELSFDQRITAAGYTPWSYVSENLAAGQDAADKVVRDWMSESPPNDGHRAAILGQAVHCGCGFSDSPGTKFRWYWTVDFGRLK